jgi:phosphatidylinositol-3-phosphatase
MIAAGVGSFSSLLVGLLLAFGAAGCGLSQSDSPPPKMAASKPTKTPSSNSVVGSSRSSHLVVIVMENQEYDDVIGNSSAPYVNGLARRYALATNFYGVTHPSLPNYLALIGGDTFGITSDCTSCHVSGKNLVDELESARVSWKAYMESMPAPCYRGATAGAYAKKHNPFAYYDSIAKAKRRCSKIVPYPQLARDMRRGRLPTFVWISPNLCHDTHDCAVKTGDDYLAGLVPSLLHGLGPHGVLFLTWDEGSSNRGCCQRAAGGHIPTIVAGPDVRPGKRSSVPYDHYSTLRTISDLLHVAPLRNAACPCTKPLDALFSRRPKL